MGDYKLKKPKLSYWRFQDREWRFTYHEILSIFARLTFTSTAFIKDESYHWWAYHLLWRGLRSCLIAALFFRRLCFAHNILSFCLDHLLWRDLRICFIAALFFRRLCFAHNILSVCLDGLRRSIGVPVKLVVTLALFLFLRLAMLKTKNHIQITVDFEDLVSQILQ